MINNLLFSVIIPTYNRGGFIGKAIQSVLEQSYTNFEMLIIDDGSTDKTRLIVNEFSDYRIHYFYQENKERAAARNWGVELAKGKYVTFLDSDDVSYPEHLATAYSFFIHTPEAKFLHLGYHIKNSDGKIIKIVNDFKGNISDYLIKGNVLSCNGVFIERATALENKFNSDRKLSVIEDWELWLRMASKFKLHYSNIVTSSIINHEERSVLTTDKNNLIERINVFLFYIYSNEDIKKKYMHKLNIIKSYSFSYVSLHLALTKKNSKIAIFYLLKAFLIYPPSVFNRRILAIIKHLIK